MAVYNGAEFLGEAIESILNQTLSDFELIIVNDGSSDDTPVLLAGYAARDARIQKYCFQANRGLAVALNYGIRHASGEYIARMDADDISLPQRLEKQVAFMEANPEVGICGAWVELIGDVERQVWEYPAHHAGIVAKMLFSNALAHPSVMICSGALKQLNLQYDERIRYAQDYELWSRAISWMRLANIPQILVQHRRHANSTGNQFHTAQLNTHEIVARRLLAPFGLGDSDEDINLHCKIGAHQYERDLRFLCQTRVWLRRLSVANLKFRIIPPDSMAAELGQHWTMACLRSGVHPTIVLACIVFTRLHFRGKTGFSKIRIGLEMFFYKLFSYFKHAMTVE